MATLLQLKCEANSWKKAYTTKSVQITNYIKAKSTLRHIYMIQMCVYNSILAGRLGDCWLAPGRLLAGLHWEGCWLAPGKLLLLAGLAGKAGWPLGRLLGVLNCWFSDFWCCCWRGEVWSWCWFFGALECGQSWELMLIFQLPLRIWLETVVCHYEMFKNRPVTQSMASSKQEEANMADQCSNVMFCRMKILDLTNFNVISWIFMDKYRVSMVCINLSLLFSSRWGSYLVHFPWSKVWMVVSSELDPLWWRGCSKSSN